MFARVSTYRAADAGKLLEGFAAVTEPLEEIEGFSYASFLVDRETGKAMSITVWKTQEALLESAARADELRQKGASLGGGTIESVEHYEIGLTVGTPEPAAAS